MKKLFFKINLLAASLVLMSLANGCASNQTPLPTPEHVDLEQFMGRWYVHGYTPILVDKQAHNAIEHYRLDANQKIQTTYQFRDGSFDGELKTYTPVGWVHDETTNAEWRMQFIWPFRSDYIILHVDADYTETIIGHPGRNYAWIMTRESEISDESYARLMEKLKSAGYDTDILKKLPQDWSGEAERLEELTAERL
ncbi:MAG: apolipoprotein D and lipocalin family protein [Candidatus Azotimanducaceae bacterium]|jgi:apolipoprotein D and lipocalin family protein